MVQRAMSAHADPWLAGLFGHPVYRLDVAGTTLMPEPPALRQTPVFVFAKVPTRDAAASQWLEAHGFHLVDTSVVFDKPIDHRQPPPAQGAIRAALPADRKAVMNLARRSFVCSRFHLDPRVPRALADQVKAEWVGNYFSGQRGDVLWVAERDQQIVGFLLLLKGGETDLIIDLIAVDESCRGRGLARALIACAEAQSDRARLVVGTQVANVSSVRMYEACGFRLRTSHYIYHFHSPQPAS